MHVQIDETGTNNLPAHIEPFALFARLFGSFRAKRSDFALAQKNIGDGIKGIGGIDHAPAGNQKRTHRRGSLLRSASG
jgi:hypothetical protein